MEDEDVIMSLGIMLVQIRTARRALEDIERSTSRYVGFEFTKALTDAAKFGAPPMFQGALMVHVVNINDLAPGNSLGGILESLFGGIGNFVGGLFGSAVGGFFSAFALPSMLNSLEEIADDMREIIRMTMADDAAQTVEDPADGKPASVPQAQAQTGETLATTLGGVQDMVRQLTALFTAANGGTANANSAGVQAPEVLTQGGQSWMAILNGINVLLDRLMHVVDGLILLIPNVVGAIAVFVTSLGSIRREILETIRFVLRNVLLLRGVLLTTLFDIVAAAARLAAGVVGALGTTIETVLASILTMAQQLVGIVFDTISTLTTTLETVITGLLGWLVTGMFRAIRALGNEPAFQTIDHMIRILPSLLGPIHAIIAAYRNNGATMPPRMTRQLAQAHRAGLGRAARRRRAAAGARTPRSVATGVIAGFPDFRTELDAFRAGLVVDSTAAVDSMNTMVQGVTGSATRGLRGITDGFSRAAEREVQVSDTLRRRRIDSIRDNADALTNAIVAPINANGPPTGLEAIATAYQSWLTDGAGLRTILNSVDEHFRNRPTSTTANGQRGGVPGLLQGQFDRPRASVEIDEVEIIIEPPATEAEARPGFSAPGDYPLPSMTDEDVWIAYRRHAAQRHDRNLNPNDPTAILG